MSTPVKVALVALVLIGGFCAALPFRKVLEDSTPVAIGDDGLRLRTNEAPPKLVPLQVSAEGETSPAAGMLPGDNLPRPGGTHPATIWRAGLDMAETPPPQLAQDYRPWPDGSLPPQLGHVPIESRSPLGPSQGPSAVLLKPMMLEPAPMPLAPPVAELAPRTPGGLVPLAPTGVVSEDQPSVSIPAVASRKHRLRDGDTLAKLAEHYYGDASRGTEIYDANRSVLNSPDLLPIGVEIYIPGVAPRQE